MAKPKKHNVLSRREREIMHIVYRLGRVTAADVQAELPDGPSYSAVRAILRLLEEKGYLRHTKDGRRFVYAPTTRREHAAGSALREVVRTFFDGSPEQAIAALLTLDDVSIDAEEFARLKTLIDQTRRAES